MDRITRVVGTSAPALLVFVGASAPALLLAVAAGAAQAAEPVSSVYYGFRAERAEIRLNDNSEVLAFDADAFVGTDELKLFVRNETEYDRDEKAFELFETQVRLQTPISAFFDVVAGVRIDAPEGPDRVDGVIGLHGLSPQWFEIDLDLFVSEDPVLRLEIDYEGLITQRLILTPSVEIDLPLTDDSKYDFAAFAPTVEVGARLSYDVYDRLLSPYIGVHYEFALGDTADRIQAGGGKADDLFFVAGVKVLF